MPPLRSTLLAEGPTDRRLVPIIEWLFREERIEFEELGIAELGVLPKQPRSLREKMEAAIQQYPCDLLFVHRDADSEDRQPWVKKIRAAAEGLARPPVVCVVPVQEQEAWLLISWTALAQAAGNPDCRQPDAFPKLTAIERIADPKTRLSSFLQEASGLSGRRRRSFKPNEAANRLSRLIEDYSPLRRLPAFAAFEAELKDALRQNVATTE